jgi:hypothetical protein
MMPKCCPMTAKKSEKIAGLYPYDSECAYPSHFATGVKSTLRSGTPPRQYCPDLGRNAGFRPGAARLGATPKLRPHRHASHAMPTKLTTEAHLLQCCFG